MAKRKYKIRFSNNEEYNLLGYNPSNRCSASKEVKGKRDFTMSKSGVVVTNGTYNSSGVNEDDDIPVEPVSGVNTSGIKDKAVKAVADLLTKKRINSAGDFLTKAQLIAILANIKGESSCSPSYSKEGGHERNPILYEGLYAWSPTRAALMKKKCGKKYKINLEGQVDYLWEELQSKDYKTSVFDQIISTAKEEKKSLAVKAMKIMCKGFKKGTEYPDKKDIEDRIKNRTKFVNQLWKQIVTDSYYSTGNEVYNLSEKDVKGLVAVCIRENGSSKKAIQIEASVMCNLAEAAGDSSVLHYVSTAKWFGATQPKMRTVESIKRGVTIYRDGSTRAVKPKEIEYGQAIFNGGIRTAPPGIDEHDLWPGDIKWVQYGGPRDSKSYTFNKSKLIPGKSVIRNRFRSTYTFWFFARPNNAGDPYGSTNNPVKFDINGNVIG